MLSSVFLGPEGMGAFERMRRLVWEFGAFDNQGEWLRGRYDEADSGGN